MNVNNFSSNNGEKLIKKPVENLWNIIENNFEQFYNYDKLPNKSIQLPNDFPFPLSIGENFWQFESRICSEKLSKIIRDNILASIFYWPQNNYNKLFILSNLAEKSSHLSKFKILLKLFKIIQIYPSEFILISLFLIKFLSKVFVCTIFWKKSS